MGWARERKGKGRRVCASGGERAEKMPRACKWARKREQKSGGDANERARGRGKESERVGRGTYRSGSGVVEAAENAGIGDVRLAVVDLVGQGNRVAARAITETVAGGVNANDLVRGLDTEGHNLLCARERGKGESDTCAYYAEGVLCACTVPPNRARLLCRRGAVCMHRAAKPRTPHANERAHA